MFMLSLKISGSMTVVSLAALTASLSSERPVHLILTFHDANLRGSAFGVIFCGFGVMHAAFSSALA